MQKIALYRKYRPENFDQTIGQDHIVKVLSNAITENKISHAYLFSGPRGTGKTSIARILAKAINCQERKNFNPCGKCSNCVGVAEGRIMDLIEIDAASNRGIDEIRDLREKVKFSPTESEYKVFIIDEVHMLTKEAFNALLKTLEEPPEHAIFILATTEISKVPATIISRCQRHDFRRIRLSDIVTRLTEIKKNERIDISDDALELISETSEGGLRDAISLLDQIASVGLAKIEEEDIENVLGLAPHKSVSSFVSALLSGDDKKSLDTVDKAAENGVDLVNLTKSAIEDLRKIMVMKISSVDNIEGTKEQIEELKKISELADIHDIVNVSDQLLWAQASFRTNIEPRAILTIVCARTGEIKREEKIEVEDKNSSKEEKEVLEESVKAVSSTKEVKKPINPNGKWQHLLMEVKAKNNAVHACLRVANPEFSGNILVLSFPYKFHKEQVEDRKNKRLLEEVISKVYGQDFEIKCELDGNSNGNGKVSNATAAASILGGKVVEDN